MAPITSTATQAANLPQTDEVPIALLTIEHSTISTIRLAAEEEDVTSGGKTFTAAGMDIAPPDDEEDANYEIDVIVSDIDRTVVEAVRTIESSTSTKATATGQWILASEPDNILMEFQWDIVETNVTSEGVRLKLARTDLTREPFPGKRIVPKLYPGMFFG